MDVGDGHVVDNDGRQLLDPEAAAILDKMREAAVPAWHSLDPVAGRRAYSDRAMLVAGDTTAVEHVDETTIPGPAGPLGVRIYRPDARGDRPVLVYVHGGGWTLGSLDTHDEVCRRLARSAGSLVVAPDYRLAPEHPFPAALDDVAATMDWLRGHAQNYGGDPQRVAVGGDSAGGTIAAGLALRLRDTGQTLPDALVLIYPATVARFDTPSYLRNANGRLLTRADCVWFWANYLGRNPEARAWSPEQVADAAMTAKSPGGWSDDAYACPGVATDLAGMPPALVVVAGFDPLYDDGVEFARGLRSDGCEAEVLAYDGMIHGFVGLPAPIAAGRDAVTRIGRWMDTVWDTG